MKKAENLQSRNSNCSATKILSCCIRIQQHIIILSSKESGLSKNQAVIASIGGYYAGRFVFKQLFRG